MTRMSIKACIEAFSARNAAVAGIYRDGAKGILSRSVSSLAASVGDQRRELGKDLAALEGAVAAPSTELEIEIDAAHFAPPPQEAGGDPAGFLRLVRKIESEDYELLTAVSGAVLPTSIEVAERLAAFAEQAHKRSSWAQDHLDLLGI